MTNWQDDKRWADRFIPQIKSILGGILISTASFEEDSEHNTDLIVLRLNPVRIACRIRRNSYYQHPIYRHQFTIRSGRPNGTKTELAKIKDGWGDYFFYGFGDAIDTEVIGWSLLDLDTFRVWLKNRGGIEPEKPNIDGSSLFALFNIADLPRNCIVARDQSQFVSAQTVNHSPAYHRNETVQLGFDLPPTISEWK